MATGDSSELPGAPGGSWYTWWRGDALAPLTRLAGFRAETVVQPERLAALALMDMAVAQARIGQGHRAYLAHMGDALAGWGWSATREANIGELGLMLRMPPKNRYLWSFETAPEWRGQSLYPHLLQYILRDEGLAAERFWIGHEPGNSASARGILKAGFEHLGAIAILPGGAMVLVPTSGNGERVRAGAAILGAQVA